MVTAAEMRYWLSKDADYAVIDSTFLEGQTPYFGDAEREMVVLLGRHFDVVGQVAEFPAYAHTVYRRRGGG